MNSKKDIELAWLTKPFKRTMKIEASKRGITMIQLQRNIINERRKKNIKDDDWIFF
jgi:hypothetical protein